MFATVSTVLAVVFTGFLAGEELIIRYGVHPSLSRLDPVGQVTTRQALIVRLRVMVPIMYALSLITTVLSLAAGGAASGLGFRIAGLAALVVWMLSTALGTVPLNKAVNDWDAAAPPGDWQQTIARWGRIDILRSSAAVVAFVALVVGAVLI